MSIPVLFQSDKNDIFLRKKALLHRLLEEKNTFLFLVLETPFTEGNSKFFFPCVRKKISHFEEFECANHSPADKFVFITCLNKICPNKIIIIISKSNRVSKTCKLQNMEWITCLTYLQGNTNFFRYVSDYGWKLSELNFLLFYAILKLIKFKKRIYDT